MSNDEQNIYKTIGELSAKVETLVSINKELKDELHTFIDKADDRFVSKKELKAVQAFLACIACVCSFVSYIVGKY